MVQKLILFTVLLSLSVFSQNANNSYVKLINKSNSSINAISNALDSIIKGNLIVNKVDFTEFKSIKHKLTNDTLLLKYYIISGDYYYYTEQFKKVIDCLSNAEIYCENMAFTKYYHTVHNTIGIAYFNLSDYDNSLKYYHTALKHNSITKSNTDLFEIYQNIGLLYLTLKDYSKSKYYYNKAYELKQYIKKDNDIAALLVNMANMYKYDNKQYNKSIQFHKLALSYYNNTNNIIGITTVYNNLGDMYELSGKTTKALEYYKKANKNFHEIDYKYGTSVTYYNIANIYFIKKELINAKKNINLSISYADSISNIEMLRDAHEKLYEIEAEMGQYKNSLNSHKKYIIFKDSIINTHTLTELSNIESKHKHNLAKIEIIELKEQSIAEKYILLKKKEELSKQKYTTIILFLTSIILVFIVLFIKKKYKLRLIKKDEEISDVKGYLKTSEARFKILFEEFPDSIFIEDHNGVILYVNNAACKLYKKTKEKIIGLNIRDLSPDIEKESIITDLNYWINRKENNFRSFAYPSYGDKIPIDIKFSLINFDGENAGMFLVRDITDQISIEEKLSAERGKVIRANNLKSLFLSNISHEIRTPMNAIIGFSDLLKKPNITKEKLNSYSDIIINNSEILIKSIEDIIDISKLESNSLTINYSECNPRVMFNEIYDCYATKAQNIELNLVINNQFDDKIKTDPYRCKQIIENLLGNAIKFTENGKIDFGFNINESSITIFVNDTGIGIPEDKMQYIFDAFYQIQYDNNLNYGTGLGLPIIKKITELLDGEINIESKLGEGTKVSCTFPLKK